jgi:hypothetical protein
MCIHLFNSILASLHGLGRVGRLGDGLVRLDRLASGPGFDMASGLYPSI